MSKPKHWLLLIILLNTGCYSLQKSIESGKPYNEQINWPESHSLSNAEFYIHNKIEIEAPPEIVWNILVEAEAWPDWYEGMQEVEVIGSDSGLITASDSMRFITMKRQFSARVTEYLPFERLSWETLHPKMSALHTWLIIPTDKGCLVVTDESQTGQLARLQKAFLPNKLKNFHDLWLQGLKAKAESKSKSSE